ncbi:MAG: preprotein translocase subunit SecA [Desulfobacteraceae bacterium]|nr:preprotein translocase subunit SecA [Desulfobacteraceae bacterium]MDH3566324.1 preprotein translocase subunit SecA [Desulfobacteraceae bacterium]
MVSNLLTKVFGSKNERELKKIQPVVEKISALEPRMQAMSDDELKAQTQLFKDRLNTGESLDDLLPEAFAAVREASVRTLGMRHFDVQLIGGMVLHQGKIAEMKTGEGKTLAATLPAYLNALSGKGVHIVTVNDYLARRDTEWMGHIYKFLGLSVGCILHGLDDKERKAAYGADITYGTNNEFGFDYLRDNMKFDSDALVQKTPNFAIVDEVDSILIDEARTPLIISGPAEKSTDLYHLVNGIIPRLVAESDFTVDEKARSVVMTEEGMAKAEKMLKVDNLYDPKNIELLHHVNQGLKAYTLFKRDVDYIVKNGEVTIVDEFTGRLMPGRRYSEGLHQALEAKENVKIENENQTLATITFQNYFRMYNKLAGMTGTADTEAAEFKKIYNLDVMVIPTNQNMIRIDNSDVIYKTRKEKYDAALEEIIELHKKGQPVLVGTISIDVSESFSEKLKKRGIKHTVLNAKNHEKEAEIIAMAGQKSGVTISTNMAGRGTDIVLGEGVTELGGLHILGTERHESRRIDNQLRGRSGRQGDPGSSRFFLALEDDLLRIFGGERITGIMEKLGMEEGEPIENRLISRAIENAQGKVEGHNFDIRKQLLEYDDVMNQQREVIYRQRREALDGKNLKSVIEEMVGDKAEEIAETYSDERTLPEEWDWKGLNKAVFKQFNLRLNEIDADTMDGLTREGVAQLITDACLREYEEREAAVGAEDFRHLERIVMLQTVDNLWKDHLLSMDHLKEGIGLRGYAQQDPLLIYKKEGFELFQDMISRIKEETVGILFRIQISEPKKIDDLRQPKEQKMIFSGGGEPSRKNPVKRTQNKVGRNAPCPCGSGKKFKKCCGR